MQEGTFFGDILDTGALTNLGKPVRSPPRSPTTVTAPASPSGASGVVAGRLGASQTGAPYMNPFGNGALCQNDSLSVGQFSNGISGSCPSGSSSNPAAGCPDGYKALTTSSNGGVWQHGITVWRNNNYTPVFDTSYQYTLSPTVTQGLVVDCGTSPIQQYRRVGQARHLRLQHDGERQQLDPVAVSNPGQCLDAGAGTNGTGIVMASCNGSAQQAWYHLARRADRQLLRQGHQHQSLHDRPRRQHVRRRGDGGRRLRTSSSGQKFAIQATVVARRHQQPDRHRRLDRDGWLQRHGRHGRHGRQHLDVRLVAHLPHGSPERDRRVDRRHDGSQNNGTGVQQYRPDQRRARPSTCCRTAASDWKITMSANQNKCLGPNNNGTGNCTTIVIQDCNGQQRPELHAPWTMSASGVYAFKNVASGRCLNVAGPSTTANGALLQTVRLRLHPRHQRPVQRPVTLTCSAPVPVHRQRPVRPRGPAVSFWRRREASAVAALVARRGDVVHEQPSVVRRCNAWGDNRHPLSP